MERPASVMSLGCKNEIFISEAQTDEAGRRQSSDALDAAGPTQRALARIIQ